MKQELIKIFKIIRMQILILHLKIFRIISSLLIIIAGSKEGKLCFLPTQAIGPYILFFQYFSVFAKKNNLNLKKNLKIYVSGKSPNTQLEIMISREVRYYKSFFYSWIIKHSDKKLKSVNNVVIEDNVPLNLRNGYIGPECFKQNLEFSNKEINYGWGLLKKIDIRVADKFVCIHNKDQLYWSELKKNGNPHDVYRDSNFVELHPSIDFLISKGYKVIRVGKYQDIEHKEVISINCFDVNEKDFLDIFLQKYCIFSICGTSGIALIPWLFSTPTVHHNLIPMGEPPMLSNSILIPKKLMKNGRLLCISEILSIKENFLHFDNNKNFINEILTSDRFQDINLYQRNGITVFDNSGEEILSAVKEMDAFICRNTKMSKNQISLQKIFRKKFPNGHPFRESKRYVISPKFLDQNKYLLA